MEETEILEETNEKCLWAGVLERAIYDLKSRNHIHRSSAKNWFRSKNHHVGTFLWVCSVLDLDPDWTREKAYNLKKKVGTIK